MEKTLVIFFALPRFFPFRCEPNRRAALPSASFRCRKLHFFLHFPLFFSCRRAKVQLVSSSGLVLAPSSAP